MLVWDPTSGQFDGSFGCLAANGSAHGDFPESEASDTDPEMERDDDLKAALQDSLRMARSLGVRFSSTAGDLQSEIPFGGVGFRAVQAFSKTNLDPGSCEPKRSLIHCFQPKLW